MAAAVTRGMVAAILIRTGTARGRGRREASVVAGLAPVAGVAIRVMVPATVLSVVVPVHVLGLRRDPGARGVPRYLAALAVVVPVVGVVPVVHVVAVVARALARVVRGPRGLVAGGVVADTADDGRSAAVGVD